MNTKTKGTQKVKTQEPVPPLAASPEPTASVDKIRDILFGGQMREYEGRFTEIEQRLFSESAQLREELTGRLSRLEQELRAELRRLGESGLRERTERLQTQQASDLQLARLGEDLLARLAELGRSSSDALTEARGALGRDLNQSSADLAQRLEQLGERHEREKTGKNELAGMLRDLADRLGPAAS